MATALTPSLLYPVDHSMTLRDDFPSHLPPALGPQIITPASPFFHPMAKEELARAEPLPVLATSPRPPDLEGRPFARGGTEGASSTHIEDRPEIVPEFRTGETDDVDPFHIPSDDEAIVPPAPTLAHPAFLPETYASFPALRTSLQHQAAAFGFAIVTRRSDAVQGVGTLGCAIGGVHRTAMRADCEAGRVRQRAITTVRDGCPYTVKARRLRPGHGRGEEGGGVARARGDGTADGEGEGGRGGGGGGDGVSRRGVWTFRTVDNTHNHVANDARSLAPLRRLTVTPEIQRFIEHQVDQRVRPRQVLRDLEKHFPSAKLLANDIQTLSYRRRVARRTGHTATEA